MRAATSVGANCIEANESPGKRDFVMIIKICRKEAKECGYWLRLLEEEHPDLGEERDRLTSGATELMKIFRSVLAKSR